MRININLVEVIGLASRVKELTEWNNHNGARIKVNSVEISEI